EMPEVPGAGGAIRAAFAQPAVGADRWTVDAAKIAATVHQKGFLDGISAAEIEAARSVESAARRNLIPNGDFEYAGAGLAATSGAPVGWSFMNLRGKVAASLAPGRNGGRALRIASVGGEASGDLFIKVRLQKRHRYQLDGWIRPDNLTTTNTAIGALLSALQLDGAGMRFVS